MQFKRIEGSFPVPHAEIDYLVACAAKTIDIKGSKQGFYEQTLETIANAVFRGAGEFWLVYEGQKAYGYGIGSVAREVDNKLTYCATQAYMDPKIRRHPIVKQFWNAARERAKTLGCQHIIVVSSRSTKAYLRYLGKQWHVYATLLKEDI